MDEVMTAADALSRNQTTASSSSPSPAYLLPANISLLSAFLACAIAQFLKLFTTWYKEKRWDSKRMMDSGGMPSSHSATVMALVVSIGLQDGTGGPTFAIAVVLACVGFALIAKVADFFSSCVMVPSNEVMYDASGIRLHAGRQAEMLNQIVCEFPPEHPLSNARPLRDSLGHTPLQVVAGALLGCIVAYMMKTSN